MASSKELNKIGSIEKLQNRFVEIFGKKDVQLFDVDANYTNGTLRNDANALLTLAREGSGVRGTIVPGSSLSDSREALKIGQEALNVWTTVGVHPYEARSSEGIEKEMSEIRDLIKLNDDVVVAVGECGLDYSDGFPDSKIQKMWFEPQVKLACDLKLPLFLHERNASKDFLKILDTYKDRLPRVLVHCFTGTKDELNEYLSRGFYVSFSGVICKSKRGQDLRNAISETSKKRLCGRYMIETDAPYLGFSKCRFGMYKDPKRSSPNVSSALPLVALALSKCLEVTPLEVAKSSTATAEKFFGVEIK
eukprot:g6192.t1